VVEAYRSVANAFERKHMEINAARGYAVEKVLLAEGTADALLERAEAYTEDKVKRAEGDASKFVATAAGYETAPRVTAVRLFLETMENVLTGVPKVILDTDRRGKQRITFLNASGINARLGEILKRIETQSGGGYGEEAEEYPE